MSKIASEVLVERLAEWGVDTIFGLPGDGINGIMEGLRRHKDVMRFVLVHHEEAAAFMATGYAKSTGKLGVCLATSGPGAIHLLNGLYDAKLDHVPVLAITGMQETQMLGTGYQQEVALEKLFIDVAEYNEMIRVPVQLPTLVDIAVRHAYGRRGVAHLTIPTDIQMADADADPWSAPAPAVIQPTAPVYLPVSGVPREEDVVAAAEVLNAGEKVAMLVGAGALYARGEVLQTAARLASPIIKTLPGKAVVPDDHPMNVGGLGLLGTAPAQDAIEGCDTLLMVGTNFPYTKYLPEPGQCKVVQIEADPIRAGNRIATEVPMIADSAKGLSALLPHQDGCDPVDPSRSDPAPVPHGGDRPAGRTRCDPGLGLGHHRDVGGQALHHPRSARVLPVRQLGHHGPRPPLYDRQPDRAPPASMHRLRR
jgi:pyruvate dehydrogenase (quinone)/pyruvate oxidase